MTLIGICGKMCSGKDTFYLFIKESSILKQPIHQVTFAAKIKEIAKDIFDVEPEDKNDRGRRIMQRIGSHMRNIEPLCWVTYTMKISKQFLSKGEHVVITDVRHLNEAATILDSGGYLIILEASDHLRRERLFIRDGTKVDEKTWEKWGSHESEKNVDDIIKKFGKHPKVISIYQTTNDFTTNRELLKASLEGRM